MKYKVQPSTRFTKDLKLCKSRGWDTEIIKKVIKKLSNGMPLEEKYKDHSLSPYFTLEIHLIIRNYPLLTTHILHLICLKCNIFYKQINYFYT